MIAINNFNNKLKNIPIGTSGKLKVFFLKARRPSIGAKVIPRK